MQVFFLCWYQDKKMICAVLFQRPRAVFPNYVGITEKNNSGFIVKNNHQFFISDILCYESQLNVFVQEWESRDEEYFIDNNTLMLLWILWLLLQNLGVVTMEFVLLCAAEQAKDLCDGDLLQWTLPLWFQNFWQQW